MYCMGKTEIEFRYTCTINNNNFARTVDIFLSIVENDLPDCEIQITNMYHVFRKRDSFCRSFLCVTAFKVIPFLFEKNAFKKSFFIWIIVQASLEIKIKICMQLCSMRNEVSENILLTHILLDNYTNCDNKNDSYRMIEKNRN